MLCLVNRLSIKAYESQTRDVTGVSVAKMQTNIIELLPMPTVCAQTFHLHASWMWYGDSSDRYWRHLNSESELEAISKWSENKPSNWFNRTMYSIIYISVECGWYISPLVLIACFMHVLVVVHLKKKSKCEIYCDRQRSENWRLEIWLNNVERERKVTAK